ncbi:ion channel [Polynucleobacter sp.]|uniref:ion channel n=1 Tax=Polynucleobacter sp. TaxID=2029855 RepID=UPI00333E5F76
MEVFSYLPTLHQLVSQLNDDIGNTQYYWIIAFASGMLVFHGMYIMLVVLCFHKLIEWLSNKRHMTKDFLHAFRIAAVISYFISILLVILGHFADILMWTYALIALKIFTSNPEAFYFAGEMYTTVGFGSYQLEKNWRILPIIIAFTGIFAASMSGAALFNMLSSLIDKSRTTSGNSSFS